MGKYRAQYHTVKNCDTYDYIFDCFIPVMLEKVNNKCRNKRKNTAENHTYRNHYKVTFSAENANAHNATISATKTAYTSLLYD